MYTGRRYSFIRAAIWTKGFWISGLIVSSLVFVGYHYLKWKWLALPAAPLAIIGTAVSFYLGFKGNAAYGRLWEARKIWGGIVNTSRTWGVLARDYVTDLIRDEELPDEEAAKVHQELIYRHIAWLNALRTQLRRPKTWEVPHASAVRFRKMLGTDNMSNEVLEKRIAPFVDEQERTWTIARKNPATQLLATQSRRLKELRAENMTDDFRHMELGRLIETMYTLQGKCERIKNFPLPRQYATLNSWFVTLFVFAVPFTLVPAFAEAGRSPYLAIPLSTVLGWAFLIWNKILDWSENPFEGLGNDIPIDALTRTIEIDLREMLGEEDLPPPAKAVDMTLM